MKGDIVDIVREEGKTEVIVQEGRQASKFFYFEIFQK